jgi:hypothetical protein
MTTRTDFSEKMKKDGNSAPIADRSRNGSGMLPRSPRSIDGAGASKKVFQRVEGYAFTTTNGSQDYIQTIYLDTLSSFTYTKIYAESTDMDDDQKYNGESNILATFSTDKHWNYSDGVFNNYPVYYVYPTSVRFVPPADRYEYQPTELALYTQQMVGPIPKSAIVNRETVKIYMDVSYDGEYHVKDSILIQFQPK